GAAGVLAAAAAVSVAAAARSAAAARRGGGDMRLLTPEEHAEIRAAIQKAEQTTSGEIFCVVAEEAADYRETPIAAGALAALVLPALLLLAGLDPNALLGGWRAGHFAAVESHLVSTAALLLAAQAVIFALAALIATIPAVRRWLTPRGLKRERVRRRALEQ